MATLTPPMICSWVALQLPPSHSLAEIGQECCQIPWTDWFSSWGKLCTQSQSLPEAGGYELSLVLSDDDTLRQYNSQYRNLDKPTDVLAFAALESPTAGTFCPGSEPLNLGDLLISLEQANRQAVSRGHSLAVEVVWLAAHGFLHLLGWDHPDESSLLTMLTQQSFLLTHIGIEPPSYD